MGPGTDSSNVGLDGMSMGVGGDSTLLENDPTKVTPELGTFFS